MIKELKELGIDLGDKKVFNLFCSNLATFISERTKEKKSDVLAKVKDFVENSFIEETAPSAKPAIPRKEHEYLDYSNSKDGKKTRQRPNVIVNDGEKPVIGELNKR